MGFFRQAGVNHPLAFLLWFLSPHLTVSSQSSVCGKIATNITKPHREVNRDFSFSESANATKGSRFVHVGKDSFETD